MCFKNYFCINYYFIFSVFCTYPKNQKYLFLIDYNVDFVTEQTVKNQRGSTSSALLFLEPRRQMG